MTKQIPENLLEKYRYGENNPLIDVLEDFIKKSLPMAEVEYMPHEDLKKLSAKCRFAIRTGEFSPYPNVILRAGVVF